MPATANPGHEKGQSVVRRQYVRAPIVEAVLEISADVPADVTPGALGSQLEPERQRYDQKFDVSTFGAGVTIDATGVTAPSATAQQQLMGYMFVDPHNHRLFQVRRNGFLHSKQAPYDKWESFRDEARRLWQLYVAAARPTLVRRLGLRYINRLDLPTGEPDLKEYLLTGPEIALGIAQSLSGYTMQLDIPQPDIPNCLLIIREAIVKPPRPNVFSIVFDMDILCGQQFNPSDTAIWTALEQMHTRADETFERSITDRVREIIA